MVAKVFDLFDIISTLLISVWQNTYMELKKKDASVSENLFDQNIIQNEKILIFNRL